MSEPTPLAFRQEGEGWHLDPPRHRWFRLGIGAVGVMSVVAGVGNLAEGDVPAGAGLLVLAGVLLATAVGLGRRRTPMPPRHLASDPGPGLLLPVRGGGLVAILGFSALALLFLAAAAAGVGLLVVDGDPVALVVVVGGTGLGALFAAGARGSVVLRRSSDLGILLTPHAVVLRTRQPPETIPWSELVAVRDHWGRGLRVGPTMPDDLIRNWLTFETRAPDGDRLGLLSGSPSPSVAVETLGTDPAAALALCRHYLEHPEDRPGLATADGWRRRG